MEAISVTEKKGATKGRPDEPVRVEDATNYHFVMNHMTSSARL